MKLTLLIVTGICSLTTLNAKLIEKITSRSLTTEAKTSQVPPRIRLTRDAFEEDTLTGLSKEDNGQSNDFIQSYNRRTREFYKPRPSRTPTTQLARKRRESTEKADTVAPNNSRAPSHPVKTKAVLVKKPIPKYSELDYEDDFQVKVSRSPVRVADSGEHEDEDFNVDDYDFDVNHDEYVSRGKPLEPRVKNKEIHHEPKTRPRKPVLKVAVSSEVKAQGKVVVPTIKIISNKKGRAAEISKKIIEMSKEDDYYEDATTTKVTEKDKNSEDELSEDAEDSKEFESKASTRLVRSPWKVPTLSDKLEQKVSTMDFKILSALPMFPAMPTTKSPEDLILTDDTLIN